jgi:hypothetical protein
MDFSVLFSGVFQTIAIIGLVIGVLTAGIRAGVAKIYAKIETLAIWREVILPLLPFVLGAAIAYCSQKYWDKTIFYWHGLLGAIASSYLYRVFKSYLSIAQAKLIAQEKEAIEEAAKPTDPPVV